jgi:hypothetical protein
MASMEIGLPGLNSSQTAGHFWFEGDLAEPVIGSVAGGFCVEEDEHKLVIVYLQIP